MNDFKQETMHTSYKNGMIGHGGGGDAVKMLKNTYYQNLLETYFVKPVGK